MGWIGRWRRSDSCPDGLSPAAGADPADCDTESSLPKRSYAMHWLLHMAAMTALGGIIAYQLYTEYVRLDEAERGALLHHVQLIAKNLSMELEATYQAVLGVRSDPTYWARPEDGKPGSRRLKTLTDAMPGVRTINILDATGKVVASNRDQLVGANLGKRPYVQAARHLADPDTVIVTPPFETYLHVFSMNLVMALPAPPGEFAGLVAATLDPDYFITLLGSTLYTHDMWSALVHGGGVQFLTVPDRADQRGKDLARPGSLFSQHKASGQAETVITGLVYATGEYRMLAQATIKPPGIPLDTPLVAAISRDYHAIHAKWRDDALKEGTLYVILLVVSSIGLFFYQRHQKAYDRSVAEAKLQVERASRAKSYFMANMSHEIRTPLNSIIGFSELIRDRSFGPLNAEYVEAAGDIRTAGITLLTLVNDILNVSKIEAGKMELEPASVPGAAMFAEVVRVFQLKAEAGGVTLSTALEPPELTIWADERGLRHILFNLVSNAIKFSGAGGSVAIGARRTPDGGTLLSVVDTGIGIPGHEIERIIRPFEQLDNRFSRAHGGTGLGLPLVDGLAALHGGRLTIESEPGKGSTFSVYLPPPPLE